MKRIFYFLVTNLAIVLVLSITMRLLGVEPFLNANGLNLNSLLIFATVMGFGGAFISLAISKWSAKQMSGAVTIENPKTPDEIWLMNIVKKQSQAVGIQMPEVVVSRLQRGKARSGRNSPLMVPVELRHVQRIQLLAQCRHA